MLVYSATTAKAYKLYHKTEVMTTAQREQFCRAFKKYVIERYKRTGRHFSGKSKVFSRDVFGVSLYEFYNSSALSALAISKKLPMWEYFNTGNDAEMVCKKTITMLKAAGYKADQKNGMIYMWKVK